MTYSKRQQPARPPIPEDSTLPAGDPVVVAHSSKRDINNDLNNVHTKVYEIDLENPNQCLIPIRMKGMESYRIYLSIRIRSQRGLP